MGKAIGVIIILIIVVLIAYYAISRIVSDTRFIKFFSWSNLAPGTTTISQKPAAQVYIPSKTAPAELTPAITPPKGFTLAQISPYYGKVRIRSVSPAYYWNSMSQFSLQGEYSLSQPINITNWILRANKGGDIFVPQGVSDYNPYRFLAKSDIYLNSSDYVYFYSTESKFGFDFRLNKCTGYLNNAYEFNPKLPTNCPSVNRSDISSFPGRCQSFILSLWSCEQPTPEEVNAFNGSDYYGCIDFLNNINYGSCYGKYHSDSDFFSHEWRVWLGKALPFDSAHDRLLLFDSKGLLVDEYTY